MRLGIDLDGVVADFHKGWTTVYAEEFGVPPSDTDPEWDGLHRLTHFPDEVAFWGWFNGRRIFGHLPLIPGALEGLSTLVAGGHQVVVLTDKPDVAVNDTLRWIADLDLPIREIHMTAAKHEVPCDVYFDDSPLQVPRLVQYRPDALVCRMVAPWNHPVAGAVDINDWPSFSDVVASHAA